MISQLVYNTSTVLCADCPPVIANACIALILLHVVNKCKWIRHLNITSVPFPTVGGVCLVGHRGRGLTEATIIILHFCSTCPSGRIEVYQDNLAYITVLFPESEIVRKHLREPRPRLKTLTSSLEDSPTHSSYNTLLSSHAVPSQKQQILFLYVLVSFM